MSSRNLHEIGNPVFFDSTDLQQELVRVAGICNGCRICSDLCPSFEALFGSLENRSTGHPAPSERSLTHIVDLCYQCQLCYQRCPYTPPHDSMVDFPLLMLRARLHEAREGRIGAGDRFLGNADLIGAIGSLLAPFSNWIIRSSMGRWLLEKTFGVHRQRSLPPFRRRSFDGWFQRRRRKIRKASAGGGGKALLFPTCMVNYCYPEMGIAAVQVLLHNDVDVIAPPTRCCGLHHLEAGNLEAARANAEANTRTFRPFVEDGYTVVVLQPSCSLMLKVKAPWLLGTGEARRVAAATRHFGEYLEELHAARRLRQDFATRGGRFALHAACLARAHGQGAGPKVLSLIPGARVRTVECCSGMGGIWGLKARHHELSLQTAAPFLSELQSDRDEVVVSDCIFAGLQVEESLGRRGRHSAEIIRDAYGLSPSGDLVGWKGRVGT